MNFAVVTLKCEEITVCGPCLPLNSCSIFKDGCSSLLDYTIYDTDNLTFYEDIHERILQVAMRQNALWMVYI